MNPDFLIAAGALGAVVAAIALVILWRPSIALVATPEALDVVQYETAPTELQLQRRAWRYGKWVPVGGTFLVRVEDGNPFTVDPSHGSSNAIRTSCRFSITGASEGTGDFVVSGTPEGASQACLRRITVRVAPHPEGDRRIRHTPKSLAALVRKA